MKKCNTIMKGALKFSKVPYKSYFKSSSSKKYKTKDFTIIRYYKPIANL